jgi:O-methyltransferase
VKGWFAQTIPGVRDQVGPIALLHLDGEWYESTKTCLDLLHDSVVPAGWVVVDDYGH